MKKNPKFARIKYNEFIYIEFHMGSLSLNQIAQANSILSHLVS